MEDIDAELVAKSEAASDPLQTDAELSRLQKSIRSVHKALCEPSTSFGQKRKYESQAAHLKSSNLKAKVHLQKQGAGLQREKRSDNVRWMDLKSAFRSRIRTGAVINLTHKCVDTFLPDAMMLIKRRLQNSLKKNVNLKVNMELSCIYELVRTGEVEDKFFATPNIMLTPTTDIDEDMGRFSEIIQTKVCYHPSLIFPIGLSMKLQNHSREYCD